MELSNEIRQLQRTTSHIAEATHRIAELHTLAREIERDGGDCSPVEAVIETCMVMLEDMILSKQKLENAILILGQPDQHRN